MVCLQLKDPLKHARFLTGEYLNGFKGETSCNLPGPPDCFLYSKEGMRIKIHKQILMQTKFFRKIFVSAFGGCRGECIASTGLDSHVLLPDVTTRHLKIVVKFIYTGDLSVSSEDLEPTKNILTKIFGFPEQIPLIDLNVIEPPKVECFFCTESLNVQEYFPHLWQHVIDELDDQKLDMEQGVFNKVECFVCKGEVFSAEGSPNDRYNSLMKHYQTHKVDLKDFIHKNHNYQPVDTEKDLVEVPENDLEEQPTNTVRKPQEPAPGTSNQQKCVIKISVPKNAKSSTTDRTTNSASKRNKRQKKTFCSRRILSSSEDDDEFSENENRKRQKLAPITNPENENRKRQKLTPITNPENEAAASSQMNGGGLTQINFSGAAIEGCSSTARVHQHLMLGANLLPLTIPQNLLPKPRKQKAQAEQMTCAECFQTVSIRQLDHHSATHHEKLVEDLKLTKNNDDKVVCPHCPKDFRNLSTAKTHALLKHSYLNDYLVRQNMSIRDLYLPTGEEYTQEVLDGDPSAEQQEDPDMENNTQSLNKQ